MAYDNILSAIGRQDPSLQLRNLNAADELTKKGIDVSDLARRLEELEGKVRAMGRDDGTFKEMESVVRDDPEVAEARLRMERARDAAIAEMCMSNPRFAEAKGAYENAVSRRYAAAKPQGEP